jgi:hypothetical protein
MDGHANLGGGWNGMAATLCTIRIFPQAFPIQDRTTGFRGKYTILPLSCPIL